MTKKDEILSDLARSQQLQQEMEELQQKHGIITGVGQEKSPKHCQFAN